jgi:hypothetical protein
VRDADGALLTRETSAIRRAACANRGPHSGVRETLWNVRHRGSVPALPGALHFDRPVDEGWPLLNLVRVTGYAPTTERENTWIDPAPRRPTQSLRGPAPSARDDGEVAVREGRERGDERGRTGSCHGHARGAKSTSEKSTTLVPV